MSQYLLYAFQSPVVQKQMVGVGSGLLHIHLRDLRVDLIPLPPLPEQQEIVRRVENLFAFADRIEARLATAQKTVERLTPATLAKAFRGELVPQDPADEPAGVLLERLAASSESAPKPKRRMTRK
jgi:type I restriction enzyme S subunit